LADGRDPVDLDIRSGPGQLQFNATLPLWWLVNVWGRGVAAVDGHLVLDVLDHQPGRRRLGVTAVRWDPPYAGAIVPSVTTAWLVHRDGEWRAEPGPGPTHRGPTWWSTHVGRGAVL
jgi:hypothetical protein